MSKVLLTYPLPPAQLTGIQAALADIATVEMPTSLDPAELERLIADADVLLNVFRPLSAELLSKAPRLRFIQQLSVGYDNLDLAALAQAKIMAANTPGANTEAVAEHTLLLMLALLRDFRQAETMARANQWQPTAFLARVGDLSTATVGLVGFGNIAQAVARRLHPFGPRLLYWARRRVDPEIEQAFGVSYADFDELLAHANIVSLHLPATPQTRHLIGEKELARLQPGSFLVNTGRGELVDEAALLQAIKSGHLAGAGLDVLQNEQAGGNPFTELPQVIVTPHTGGISPLAAQRITRMALANVRRFLSGELPLYLITEPASSDSA